MQAIDDVDSLGAGDAFHGSYAFARSAGELTPDDTDVQANLAVAASVAALKCSRPGTRSWLHHLHTTVLRESQG